MAKRNIQGRVQGVNDSGVNIDGTWYNFSKFFAGERQPARGSSVTAVIGDYKDRDYLNELTVIGGALPNGSPAGAPAATTGAASGGRSTETDHRIARQVALKAAVEYGVSLGHAVDELLSVARNFEAFLNEPYGQAPVSLEDAA